MILKDNSTFIDLQELSTQLLESKPPLKDAVSKTKAAITIKAKDLVSLYPELKSINSLPLINYRKNNSGSIAVLTLNIYKFQDNPVITIPDSNCNITEDFEIKSYFLDVESAKNYSYAIITHKQYPIAFKINISLNNSKVNDLVFDESEKKEIQGLPNPEWLNDKPEPIVKLENLPINDNLEVISIDGKTDKFESQLITVKDSKNQVYQNCVCNSELYKLVKKYGTKLKFQVTDIKFEKQKGKTKKEMDRELAFVSIRSLMNDYSKVELNL